MSERQDVILGAGLSGLTAGYTLQRAGEDHWQIYERQGNAVSESGASRIYQVQQRTSGVVNWVR